jgi:hypothetical protein
MTISIYTVLAAAFAFGVGQVVANWACVNLTALINGVVIGALNRRQAQLRLHKFTCGQCTAGLDTYYCPRCGWHSPPSDVDTTFDDGSHGYSPP